MRGKKPLTGLGPATRPPNATRGPPQRSTSHNLTYHNPSARCASGLAGLFLFPDSASSKARLTGVWRNARDAEMLRGVWTDPCRGAPQKPHDIYRILPYYHEKY